MTVHCQPVRLISIDIKRVLHEALQQVFRLILPVESQQVFLCDSTGQFAVAEHSFHIS